MLLQLEAPSWALNPPQPRSLVLGSMEPGVGRLPLQVLGENEALQQFFSGWFKLTINICFVTSPAFTLVYKMICNSFKGWALENTHLYLRFTNKMSALICSYFEKPWSEEALWEFLGGSRCSSRCGGQVFVSCRGHRCFWGSEYFLNSLLTVFVCVQVRMWVVCWTVLSPWIQASWSSTSATTWIPTTCKIHN